MYIACRGTGWTSCWRKNCCREGFSSDSGGRYSPIRVRLHHFRSTVASVDPARVKSYVYLDIRTMAGACICAYRHVCGYMHVCASMHVCMHVCMWISEPWPVPVYVHIRTYMHVCTYTCMHACIHTYIHAYIHTYMQRQRACKHARIHARANTRILVLPAS